jgi:glycosyltransferase involved in cell wall biosynthesis
MKIINIVPGFGGTFYCGNCLRDSGFVSALKAAGHEAHTLPIYLPLFAEGCNDDEDIPVFYGAVNIYLKQNYRFFRNMPKWMERFFDSSPILRYAAKKAGSTRAEGLEDMTMSMLRGHEGYQADELEMLINYLKNHEKPDIIHLSNALLLGLAYKIKTELNIPVVCSLQDENVWVDAMEESLQTKVWDLMNEKAKDVDAFIAVSNYFAGVMKDKMRIPEEKLHAIHIGINPENYKPTIPNIHPPVIGYLSRRNEENGFKVLIDAFIELKDTSAFKNARLKVSGGKTADDNKFISRQMKKLKQKGYHKDIEFIDDFTLEALPQYFSGLTVLTVPVLKGEAFGLYQLQALASGIPLVQPALGAFPEVINETGGGLIYEPNQPKALAKKWEELFSKPESLAEMSQKGRESAISKFNMEILTKKMVQVYQSISNK